MMENPRLRSTTVRLTANNMTYSTEPDIEDLDDTLPVELLDCIETTTNEDWLTRDIPLRDKRMYTEATRGSSTGNDTRSGSSVFNPPLCSTRLKLDGSSAESAFSSSSSLVTTERGCSSSLMAEHGSSEQLVTSDQRIDSPFVPPLMPAASMEFQPLRCSTAVTANDVGPMPAASMEFQPLRCSTAVTANDVRLMPSVDFEIRCDTTEFDPVRHSVDVDCVAENQKSAAQQNHFIPTQCSTRIVGSISSAPHRNIVCSPDQVLRPPSPEEFLSARGSSVGNILDSDSETQFVTAFSNIALTNGCTQNEQEMSDGLEVPEICETAPCEDNADLDADSGLSILMQCRLKIRSGGKVLSNIQAKPQIEFSVLKDSLSAIVVSAEKSLQAKPSRLLSVNKVQKQPKEDVRIPHEVDPAERHAFENELHSKITRGGSRTSLKQERAIFQSPKSAASSTKRIPIANQMPIKLCSDSQSPEKDAVLHRANPDNRERHIAKVDNRLQCALDNLASSNIQKVVGALAVLDSARSDLLCETIVELRLVDRIYDFFSKMNRSVAHQVACVHATSLLLDLAKYSFSTESAWQDGTKVGLILNLMSIWVTKDNSIFMNSAAILWAFSRDETRATIIRRSAGSQNKLLEKMSIKLNTRISKFTVNVKAPASKPSWTNAGARRTFDSPLAAFSSLCNVLQKSTRTK